MDETPAASATALPAPHHAGLALGLGIAGLVCSCFPISIAVWILAHKELRYMDVGTVDASGRGMTESAKILGIVGTLLGAIGLLGGLFFLALSFARSITPGP